MLIASLIFFSAFPHLFGNGPIEATSTFVILLPVSYVFTFRNPDAVRFPCIFLTEHGLPMLARGAMVFTKRTLSDCFLVYDRSC